MYPMTFEYLFPDLVAVLAARTFKTVFASFPIKPSTDTINGVKRGRRLRHGCKYFFFFRRYAALRTLLGSFI
jgi:hypothetical protein